MSTSNWDKNRKILDRKQSEIRYENGEPHYRGYHLISRDTKVDSGVYLGGLEREAVVVDTENFHSVNRLYHDARINANTTSQTTEQILEAAYTTVNDTLEFDPEGVSNIVNRYHVSDDELIQLDVFIDKQTAECRHFALTTAAILEKFEEDNKLFGKTSVDRNYNVFGSHAWTRYTEPDGSTYILDPAENVFEPLENTQTNQYWDYARPEDNL